MSSVVSRVQFGKNVETKAIDWFLVHKKAKLLLRNYRCRSGEIDLVFEEFENQEKNSKPCLVFVEVRARSRNGMLEGLENINWKKEIKLRKTAEHFLSHYRGPATDIRFDFLYWNGTDWSYFPNFSI